MKSNRSKVEFEEYNHSLDPLTLDYIFILPKNYKFMIYTLHGCSSKIKKLF